MPGRFDARADHKCICSIQVNRNVNTNYPARLRWMITKSTRASLASQLQKLVGMVIKDTSAELKPSRMKRDCKDVAKVITQYSFSPFTNEKDPSTILFNIFTGKGASVHKKDCLLKVPEACVNDKDRFEERIPSAKLHTFADECGRNRRTTDKKIAALTCTRDLM